MAPHFFIHDGVGWVDVTDRVNHREPPTLIEKAEEGSVAMSTLILEDRDLTLEVDPFTPFVATEDTSESADKVWAAGMLAGREVRRLASGFREPFGRYWVCEVTDANERWHRRVLKAADADRGEETDNERAAWLLQQMQDWGLIDDDTTYYSSAAASADLDAEDLRGRYPDEVMGATAEAKSKNWWVQRQGDIGSLEDVAWWGIDGNTSYSSPLYLTNDPAVIGPRVSIIADGTSDVWPLRNDHGLRCIPERMYSGAWARHRTGAIYRRNGTTAGVIGVRDVVMAGTDRFSKARVINRAVRYLDDLDAEEFRVQASVRLPAAKVTQLRAGMRVPAAMTHWPFGLDAWTWWRVVQVAVTPATVGPWYDLDVELASTGDAATEPPPCCDECEPVIDDFVRADNIETYGNGDTLTPAITESWGNASNGIGRWVFSLIDEQTNAAGEDWEVGISGNGGLVSIPQALAPASTGYEAVARLMGYLDSDGLDPGPWTDDFTMRAIIDVGATTPSGVNSLHELGDHRSGYPSAQLFADNNYGVIDTGDPEVGMVLALRGGGSNFGYTAYKSLVEGLWHLLWEHNPTGDYTRVKFWADGDPEPGAWDIELTSLGAPAHPYPDRWVYHTRNNSLDNERHESRLMQLEFDCEGA